MFRPVCAGELPLTLSTLLKQSGFATEGIAVYVQAVDDDMPFVAFQEDTALNPASVVKLVTTAASLGILGSGYRWTTEVAYTGALEQQTLKGDLYFRGNGDPYLTPERFWRLLNRVSFYGIRNIAGNVYVDNSYFLPGPVDYGAFDGQPYRTYNVGPSALLVGFQATEFHFSVTQGQVTIQAFPASPKLRIVNNVKMSRGGCGAWQKRLQLDTESAGEELRVIFSGKYPKACDKKTFYRRVSDAGDHFQHYFVPIWQQLGGSLTGSVKASTLPEGATLALQEPSISLSEAIRMINKYSNNVMTRQLLLSLGAEVYGQPGTAEKGVAAVEQWLQQQNLKDDVLQLDNGAGLSRNTRVSAAMLGKLLRYTYHQAYMPEFIASLPVSGHDGTMASRFKGDEIQGHAHIKTGLLNFVQTMAGYVTTPKGQRYVVVLLQNHPKAHTAKGQQLQDEVIRWVYSL
ncbi:MAG: D-alanyl-D-alanine carboxypeptidase/D-alanyl-D-alanine-endopeptidase [Gammaproteobacteria bacterium]|nr:D-alanyl-D-alanine carboxypeptidase/D-alanyl-D-alanine-endopeptidase [Gammaproteobacteria bacterium]MDH5799917.1 D-alanyl-D-alanine carboxypeptidase/D-alanyl-D-alanine-endopeptidase [Gammaproteobacteria bacterium]